MTPLSPPVELASVGEFLAQSLPFDLLEAAELDRAVSALRVSYHPHGERFDAASEPAGLRIVRSGAVDLRDSDNKLLDRLGEGARVRALSFDAPHRVDHTDTLHQR